MILYSCQWTIIDKNVERALQFNLTIIHKLNEIDMVRIWYTNDICVKLRDNVSSSVHSKPNHF